MLNCRLVRSSVAVGAVASVALAALLVSSCGLPKRTRNLFGGNLLMDVSVSPELNGNTPVAVDVLVVYEKDLFKELLKLSARQWFEQREQLLRDNPKRVGSWSWEWVPGQEVGEITLELNLGSAGGIIFADYLAPGEHRQRFDPHEHFRLVLGDSSFSISPLK
jgi:type VI secretion system protein